jgi:hypothetical protein
MRNFFVSKTESLCLGGVFLEKMDKKRKFADRLIQLLPQDILIKIVIFSCANFPELIWIHLVQKCWKFVLEVPLLQKLCPYTFVEKNDEYLRRSINLSKIRNYVINATRNPHDPVDFPDEMITKMVHSLLWVYNVEKLTLIGHTERNYPIFPFERTSSFQFQNVAKPGTCELNSELISTLSNCCHLSRDHPQFCALMKIQFHDWETLTHLELQDVNLSLSKTYVISLMTKLETLILKNIPNQLICGQIIHFAKLPQLKRCEMVYVDWVCMNTKHVVPKNLWISLEYLVVVGSHNNTWGKNHYELTNSDSAQILEFDGYNDGLLWTSYPNARSLNLYSSSQIRWIEQPNFDILLAGMPLLERVSVELLCDYGVRVSDLHFWEKIFCKYGFESFAQINNNLGRSFIIGTKLKTPEELPSLV